MYDHVFSLFSAHKLLDQTSGHKESVSLVTVDFSDLCEYIWVRNIP